jgi:hypothetical protein
MTGLFLPATATFLEVSERDPGGESEEPKALRNGRSLEHCQNKQLIITTLNLSTLTVCESACSEGFP